MNTDKAYKLLARAKGISNGQAKALIDRGLVLCGDKKISIARAELPINSSFEVLEVKKPKVLFCDENILALEKPPFIESYELCNQYPDWSLLHRLDRETSGVILLIKAESDFALKAKRAFKNQEVYKEYMCLVHGIVPDSMRITKPISTIKKGFAKSRIDKKGLEAITTITPLALMGKKTFLKVVIQTGRTHQIRVHLQSIDHPIVGDRIYGKPDGAKRLLLHAHKISLLGYEFSSPLPKELEF